MATRRVMGAPKLGTLYGDTEDIVYWKDESDLWWIYLPGCGAGVLSQHAVVEHDDGTITVTPSILMSGHKDGQPTTKHGYLIAGSWRDA